MRSKSRSTLGSVSGAGSRAGAQGSAPRTQVSSHLGRLHAVGQREQCGAPLPLHQAPEAAHSVGEGALDCNELPEAPETLVEENR